MAAMNPRTLAEVLTDSPPGAAIRESVERDVSAPPPLHGDTRAGYPLEWMDLAPKLNRAQRRERDRQRWRARWAKGGSRV